jgi:cell division protein FtsZ
LAGRPGLINVDFADLREALRDRHAESFFACAEAAGEQRARDVVERLLLSPLLANGALLRETGNMLVSLVAGPDLSMGEVNRLMDRLRKECDGADILLGAAVDPLMGDRLSLTLIATRRATDVAQTVGESVGDPLPAAMSSPSRGSLSEAETLETDFFRRQPPARRPRSRFLPPAPELTAEQRRQALTKVGRSRSHAQQTLLPLELVSKGRFEKSEPTLHRGEDLDVPTFVRRGLVLN